MTIQDKESIDSYEKELNEKLQELQECQNKNGKHSCSACSSFLFCSLRKEYVAAVYSSMSKGNKGGFEF